MKFINSSKAELITYTENQLSTFFPDGKRSDIRPYFDDTMDRLKTCINNIKFWPIDEFDLMHSSQYCTYLYFLSNTIWRNTQNQILCTKLFLLNKALNAIDCFYEIELPDIFFIGHSAGIVLAKASYSDYLVLYQNSTIGKNNGQAPQLETGVIVFPNVGIIGDSVIKSRSIIAQGVSVINQSTEPNKIVFNGIGGELIFKDAKRDYLHDYFRF